ncbi:carboxy terminal-processing peptidase [Gynurincola endophyticus]|uniref:carboxy terminal-processing peptidase n=1 Tax=Gynurincola endophyticus TaxID=2479004 RepID=UPI000F8E8F3F|nr:carboxy terminal-processing peptidase [Gynurincola endophyticus]
MFNRRNLPFIAVLVGLALLITVNTLGRSSKEDPSPNEMILRNVAVYLQQLHYSPKQINDEFSQNIFNKYLNDRLDPQKNIFIQQDINDLSEYKLTLDDEILGAPIKFVPAVYNIYQKRIRETEALYKDILSKPFDFSKNETYAVDADKKSFPLNEAQRRTEWTKRLKYLALNRYVDLVMENETSENKKRPKDSLELDARNYVLKLMNRTYDRFKTKYNEQEQFNDYVKTIAEYIDPHTTYMPPVDKRYFEEQMSGSFFGIGASLQESDGNIKITSVLVGSPAWKSKEIAVGDLIVKVAQGKEEPIDIVGYFVEDAVKVIRGQKGTEVRIWLKKQDGSIKEVSLIRDKIIQDETFAKSAIIEKDGKKIGYIYLPEFYAPFTEEGGQYSSEDVKAALVKLNESKVEGVIIDLRNNGGGVLREVVKMVGYFIDQGPVVQVQDRNKRPYIHNDTEKGIVFNGPVTVMINEFSASASEIFAAAIQDYKRGVIIGSTSSYGKGTVQRVLGIDQATGFFNTDSELGTLKLTIQKYYRINGGSTQLKGVESDIILPDLYEYAKFREKDVKEALEWDEIKKATYQEWPMNYDLQLVKQKSEERVAQNKAFQLIKNNAEWLAGEKDSIVSLQLDSALKERKKSKEITKSIDEALKDKVILSVKAFPADIEKVANDTAKADRFKDWIKSLSENDIYLRETVSIMNDMIKKQ